MHSILFWRLWTCGILNFDLSNMWAQELSWSIIIQVRIGYKLYGLKCGKEDIEEDHITSMWIKLIQIENTTWLSHLGGFKGQIHAYGHHQIVVIYLVDSVQIILLYSLQKSPSHSYRVWLQFTNRIVRNYNSWRRMVVLANSSSLQQKSETIRISQKTCQKLV